MLTSRQLQHRLLLSYAGAFAAVIVAFSIAVRLSFSWIIQQQVTARLETLARAGTAAIEFTPQGYSINSRSFGGFVVHASTESLQWFDAKKRLKASAGRTPQLSVPPTVGRVQLTTDASALDTYTVAIADARGRVHGYVRAGETINEARGAESALDFGLVAASVLAIIAATVVGGTLASAAVLQREQSYERLREFTADASHELRTPLTALATTAGLALLEAPQLPQTTHRHLKTIVSLSDQMRKLVDDLLILARANKSLEREMFVVPVDAMLQRVNRIHASFAADKCVNLLMHHAPPIPIFGNPDQLERIVSNLVENAIRYTEPGGTVEASCSYDVTALRIAVRDTGIGIAPEHRERVFDRLWRCDNARGDGGAGLGLSIARALARRHGGDIAVWSEPGIGSVFTLTLPRRPPLPR